MWQRRQMKVCLHGCISVARAGFFCRCWQITFNKQITFNVDSSLFTSRSALSNPTHLSTPSKDPQTPCADVLALNCRACFHAGSHRNLQSKLRKGKETEAISQVTITVWKLNHLGIIRIIRSAESTGSIKLNTQNSRHSYNTDKSIIYVTELLSLLLPRPETHTHTQS